MKNLVACSIIILSGVAAAASAHVVRISGVQFVPARLQVKAGETVVWKNEDLVPHTVSDDGKFDSGTLNPDASYKFKFKKSGTYNYVCHFHPNMKAVIEVK